MTLLHCLLMDELIPIDAGNTHLRNCTVQEPFAVNIIELKELTQLDYDIHPVNRIHALIEVRLVCGKFKVRMAR